MARRIFFSLAILAFTQFSLSIVLSPPSLAQEWAVRGKQQGTIKVVDLFVPSTSMNLNYAEGLLTLDEDNNYRILLRTGGGYMTERSSSS